MNPPAVKVLTWNPSNPSIILTVPNVNRPETRKVTYEWRRAQSVIGYGKMIEAPLKAGKNVFLVRAIDQDMVGARPIDVEIVVDCE